MRNNSAPETKISKYCIATTYMQPHIKQNRFKEKKLMINKLEYA
jgi:hypothetical protein